MTEKIIRYCFFIGYLIFEFVDILKLFYPIIDTIIPNGLLGVVLVFSFFIAFLLRIKNFNRYIAIVLIIIFFKFIESAFIYGNNEFVCEIINSDLSIIIFIMMLFYSTELEPDKRLRDLRIISYFIISFNLIKLIFGGYYDENLIFSYMGFGYGTVIYWTIITLFAFSENKKIDIIISLITGLLMILLGNRGVVLIQIIIVLLLMKYYTKYYNKVYMLFFLIITGVLLYVFFADINLLFLNISKLIGLPSYIFERAINNELFADSGRNYIWNQIWSMIIENPLFGYGVGFDRSIINTYSHNLILEIMLDFGIIYGCMFIIALVWMIYDLLIKKQPHQWRNLFLVYFIPSLLMLMFSNSIYHSRDFWISIAIFCAFKNSSRHKIIKY